MSMKRSSRHAHSRIAIGICFMATLAATTLPAAAQEDNPAATPVAETDLDERIAAIPPEELLDALRDTPVEDGLFPPEYEGVTIAPWDNELDSDLVGTLGGALVTTNGNMLGGYIVHPSEESATARFEELLIEEATPFEVETPTIPERVMVGDVPAWLINTDEIDDTLLVVLRIENVIVAGGVTPNYLTPVPEVPPPATPVSDSESVSVTEAVVAHLDRVTADLAP